MTDSGPVADGGRGYRLAAVGLFVLGAAAAVAAALAPTDLREVLVALAGVGLYGAVLAYVLRPSATRDVDPADGVYDALAATGRALQRDLALPDRYVYAPVDDAAPPPADAAPSSSDGAGPRPDDDIASDFAPVYLVVRGDGRPSPDEGAGRRPVFGTGGRTAAAETDGGQADGTAGSGAGADDAGITLYPTGGALFAAYEDLAVVDLERDPVELAAQLAEAAVSGLELAADVDAAVDPAAGRAELTVRRPRFGDVSRFDHPVASFFAVGFAVGLDTPVATTGLGNVEDGSTAASASGGGGGTKRRRGVRGEYRIVCEWTPGGTDGDGRAG